MFLSSVRLQSPPLRYLYQLFIVACTGGDGAMAHVHRLGYQPRFQLLISVSFTVVTTASVMCLFYIISFPFLIFPPWVDVGKICWQSSLAVPDLSNVAATGFVKKPVFHPLIYTCTFFLFFFTIVTIFSNCMHIRRICNCRSHSHRQKWYFRSTPESIHLPPRESRRRWDSVKTKCKIPC